MGPWSLRTSWPVWDSIRVEEPIAWRSVCLRSAVERAAGNCSSDAIAVAGLPLATSIVWTVLPAAAMTKLPLVENARAETGAGNLTWWRTVPWVTSQRRRELSILVDGVGGPVAAVPDPE